MNKILHNLSLFFSFALITSLAYAQQGEWTWIKGSSGANSTGTYGTQGVPDAANNPRAVFKAGEWTDKDGNFWLFGGSNVNYSGMNALWKFDPDTEEWTWMRGSPLCCQAGVYGTKGVPSPNNMPGARGENYYTWVDTAGDLWLYGGLGYDINGQSHALSDLWRYHIADNEWTWMGGSDTGTVTAVYGTKGVAAAANTPGGRAYANATWVDDSSRLWLYGGILYNSTGAGSWAYVGCGGDMWMWDNTIGQWTWMQGTSQLTSPGVYGTKGVASPTNRPPGKGAYTRFKDSEGNFYMFGGFNFSQGYNDMWKYDWHTNEFTWVAGTNLMGNPGNYGTQCVPAPGNVPPARYENRWSWSDGCDNFWLFGGVGNTGGFNDLWHYNVLTTEFTWMSGADTVNQPGVYGTQGISDPANHPSARYGGESWADSSGNLWIFGGADIDYYGTSAKNDVWRFVIDPACPALNTCLQSAAAFGASDSALCEKFCIDFTDLSPNNPVSWQWNFEGGTPASSTDQNPSDICYNNPGTFDVTLVATYANGDIADITLPDFITVNANPFAPTISQVGNLLTSTSAFSYQWYFNGVLIPGATDESYTITESGLYTVKVTNENGCSSEASIDAAFVGIDEVNDGFFVNVFANPSSGEINISGSNPAGGEMQIQLMNSIGQVIIEKHEWVSSGFKIMMDVKDLSGGIYFLQFHTTSHQVIRKIILMK